MLLEELRSPIGKPYLLVHQPGHEPWIYADWTGYPTANNVATGALAYLNWMQKQQLHGVLNDNRHLVGRWDNSLDWLRQTWLPHAARCGLRYWAHLDNAGAMSAGSATALRELVGGQFEVEIFQDQGAAEQWLRAGLARPHRA
jgi:hypothetical protein